MIELNINKDYQVIYSKRDGIQIKTKKGTYELLEGKSYQGESSSDIVFIMSTNEKGYGDVINYTFGADYTKDCIESCCYYIEQYEKKLK